MYLVGFVCQRFGYISAIIILYKWSLRSILLGVHITQIMGMIAGMCLFHIRTKREYKCRRDIAVWHTINVGWNTISAATFWKLTENKKIFKNCAEFSKIFI